MLSLDWMEARRLSQWVLLHYKLPSKPSASRVYIWRKLKRLGAILLHSAVWVLPATAYTLEQFQWLAVEIGEMAGEATVWEAQLALAGREEALVERFTQQVDTAYGGILARLEKARPDLAALSREYQQAQARDYFGSELGRRVRAALVTPAAKGGPP